MRYVVFAALMLLVAGVTQGRAQGLTGEEVSFMDFAAVNVDSVIARIGQTDSYTLFNLRKFAAFEAAHNARGAADQARRIVESIDASGLLQNRGAPAAPSSTPVVRASGIARMKSFLKAR